MDFNLSKERGVNVGDLNKEVDNNIYPAKKYTNLGLKHIDGIPGFFDLKEALEYSKRVNKPLFIDFTGAACVNCREMESRVFSAAKVKEILNNDFVFVSVYGDIKKEVDSKDWVTLSNGKVLKSLGKINSHYIMERYNINAMPYYIIVDNQGDEIVEPRGYNLDIELFVKFLEEAKEIYKRGV